MDKTKENEVRSPPKSPPIKESECLGVLAFLGSNKNALQK